MVTRPRLWLKTTSEKGPHLSCVVFTTMVTKAGVVWFVDEDEAVKRNWRSSVEMSFKGTKFKHLHLRVHGTTYRKPEEKY